MTRYGLRRWFAKKEYCEDCNALVVKKYIWHPFPLPPPYERGHWLSSDCECIKKERKEERAQYKRLLTSHKIHPLPVGLQQNTFDSFIVTNMNKEAYQVCKSFARNFSKIDTGQGIVIYGRSGTGKTHLACAVANSLKDDYNVVFTYMPAFFDKQASLDPLLAADLLILDDIGTERGEAWILERLLVIVDHRITTRKSTVFTTNYDLADLDKRVGMRAASRILGHNLQVKLQGADWRQFRQDILKS